MVFEFDSNLLWPDCFFPSLAIHLYWSALLEYSHSLQLEILLALGFARIQKEIIIIIKARQ